MMSRKNDLSLEGKSKKQIHKHLKKKVENRNRVVTVSKKNELIKKQLQKSDADLLLASKNSKIRQNKILLISTMLLVINFSMLIGSVLNFERNLGFISIFNSNLFVPVSSFLMYLSIYLLILKRTRDVRRTTLHPSSGKKEMTALNLPKGVIRFYIIMNLMLVTVYYVIQVQRNLIDQMPFSLLVSLNLILAFYGLDPEKNLPQMLRAKEKTDKEMNNRTILGSFPAIAKTINDLQERLISEAISFKEIFKKNKRDILREKKKIANILQDHEYSRLQKSELSYNVMHENITVRLYERFHVLQQSIEFLKDPQTFLAKNNPGKKLAGTLVGFGAVVGINTQISQNLSVEIMLTSAIVSVGYYAGKYLDQFIIKIKGNKLGFIFLQYAEKIEKPFTKLMEDVDTKMDLFNQEIGDIFEKLNDARIQHQYMTLTADFWKAYQKLDEINDEFLSGVDQLEFELRELLDNFWSANFTENLSQDNKAYFTLLTVNLAVVSIFLLGNPLTAPATSLYFLQWLTSFYFGGN